MSSIDVKQIDRILKRREIEDCTVAVQRLDSLFLWQARENECPLLPFSDVAPINFGCAQVCRALQIKREHFRLRSIQGHLQCARSVQGADFEDPLWLNELAEHGKCNYVGLV